MNYDPKTGFVLTEMYEGWEARFDSAWGICRAWGETKEEAIQKLQKQLAETHTMRSTRPR